MALFCVLKRKEKKETRIIIKKKPWPCECVYIYVCVRVCALTEGQLGSVML